MDYMFSAIAIRFEVGVFFQWTNGSLFNDIDNNLLFNMCPTSPLVLQIKQKAFGNYFNPHIALSLWHS